MITGNVIAVCNCCNVEITQVMTWFYSKIISQLLRIAKYEKLISLHTKNFLLVNRDKWKEAILYSRELVIEFPVERQLENQKATGWLGQYKQRQKFQSRFCQQLKY